MNSIGILLSPREPYSPSTGTAMESILLLWKYTFLRFVFFTTTSYKTKFFTFNECFKKQTNNP